MTVDRSRLPAPGKTPPFHFPGIERSTLDRKIRRYGLVSEVDSPGDDD